MFESHLIGTKVDLQLDFKAPGLPETERDVKKARAFFALLKHNIRHVYFLKDFCGIKNVVQMEKTMRDWLSSAQNGDKAVYYIYPHESDQCIGCLMLKQKENIVETSTWIDVDQAGNGYYTASRQMIEKFLFEKSGVQEIISRFYVDNPSGIAVEKGLRRLKYVPCDFKALDPKPGDEKIFKTYHKTRKMYLSEQIFSSITNVRKNER